MNIPDEAIDAAWRQAGIDAEGYPYPEREEIRLILEAAAPHLQGRAWEEGYGLGYSDHVWSKGHEPRERNPYRTTK